MPSPTAAEWIVAEHESDATVQLASALNISPVTAQILVNRGITTAEAGRDYLAPSLSKLRDPFTLPDMNLAVERIIHAIEQQERIAIFGDYDTDGTTATAILIRYFRAIGIEVDYHIPHRERDGYGLSPAGVDVLAARGAELIITVDNGSTALAALAHAKARGIDVIVTDHHEVPSVSEDAVAVVNPKRADSHFGFTGLCGAGIAFYLVMALRKSLRERPELELPLEPNLKQLLDLVAVGTIADLVPLQEDNRILCYFGLQALARHPQCGLAALMRVASTPRDQLSSYHIGFQIGPRLNAAGRMAEASLGVELCITEDQKRAAQLAQELDALNTARRDAERAVVEQVETRLNEQAGDHVSIVMADEAWPAGVIGIAAGRIAERFRAPTILISLGTEPGRGSGRTVGDFALLDAITASSAALEGFGGHSAAAGVTVRAEQVEQFAQDFHDCVAQSITPEQRQKRLRIDARIPAEQITLGMAQEIASLGPFGMGNPEPQFIAESLSRRDSRIVGNNHLKLSFAAGERRVDAIAFSFGEHPDAEAKHMDCVFTLDENVWNGRSSVQMRIRDLRSHA